MSLELDEISSDSELAVYPWVFWCGVDFEGSLGVNLDSLATAFGIDFEGRPLVAFCLAFSRRYCHISVLALSKLLQFYI